MQEIKIPEGCKASIDFEKRVVVIESEYPKFKSGDIIFASDHNDWNKAIFIYMKYEPDPNGLNGYHYYTQLDLITKDLYYTDSMSSNWVEIRLATPPEAQLLFDALAKEGKKWNVETIQIEDIEKDILVPESIGIYTVKAPANKERYGDGLLIGFNDYRQMLGYDSINQIYVVSQKDYLEKVQCKLTPCKREDLEVGDTAFISETFRLDDNMLSDKGRYVKIIGTTAIKINKIGEIIYDRSFHNHWYKVEPINK